MQRLRTIQLNLREGSTGLELVSALYKILLSCTWLAGHANTNSSLFVLIGRSIPALYCLLLVGIIHVIAWIGPNRRPWIVIRKVCSSVGIGIWVSLIYDLMARGASATVILLVPVVLFLMVAIIRRQYTVV